MRNKSIFLGVKELGEFQFQNKGIAWDVFIDEKTYWRFIGSLSKKHRESNKSLYERAKETLMYHQEDANA